MTTWTEVCLGVIAFAALAIAVTHIVILVAAGLVARRIGRLIDRAERELEPVFSHMQDIAANAARAAALAGVQVERADRMFADLAERIEQVLNAVQAGLTTPIHEGRALVKAFRAGLRAILDLSGRARSRRGRSDDEDALFI
jgi:hypothetical protein